MLIIDLSSDVCSTDLSKLTWSFVKNEVLELPYNGRDRNRIGGITLADGTAFGGTAEGEPLYRYFGYEVDHILQTAEQIRKSVVEGKSVSVSVVSGGRGDIKTYRIVIITVT